MHGKGKSASLCLVLPECNSFGLGSSVRPGLDAAFADAQAGADVAIVLENDLYRRGPMDEVDDFLAAFRHVVVIDHLFHRTSLGADVVLPAATFAEDDGTLVNNEGRAQRYFQVFPHQGRSGRAGDGCTDIMASRGHDGGATWQNLDALIASMARAIPLLAPRGRRRAACAFQDRGDEDSPRAPAAQRKDRRERGRDRPRAAARRTTRTRLSPFPWRAMAEGRLRPSYRASGRPAGIPSSPSTSSRPRWEGRCSGGDPGMRLIEPARKRGAHYFEEIPGPFAREEGLLLVVPFYHVFGSDELSMLTPGRPVARACRLPRHVAGRHGGRADWPTVMQPCFPSADGPTGLPARAAPELASGVAAVACGVPGRPGARPPRFRAALKRRSHDGASSCPSSSSSSSLSPC